MFIIISTDWVNYGPDWKFLFFQIEAYIMVFFCNLDSFPGRMEI